MATSIDKNGTYVYFFMYVYREVTVNLSVASSPYIVTLLMQFTITEHYNDTFIFEITTAPVNLTLFSKFNCVLCVVVY